MDIVEEFVVTLGLDPSNYKKEVQNFRDDFRRLKEDVRRDAREIEAQNRRVAESFNRVKNEIIGLALTIAGARSIGGLVQDLIHGAAETGRFAHSIDMATERVSVWEMAVQSMGGTAQDARSALAALNAEYTNYMLTGRAVHDADLAAMGISANDLQSPEQLALALAERRNNMTQREFTARLQRMGLPDSFIRTISQGRRGVEELLDSMQRVGPVTERDARAAIEFERQWSILTNRLRSELRPVLTWLVDHALPWIAEHGPEVARVMGVAIAGAVGLMAAALIRAAGPLGIIIAGLTAIIALWPTIQRSFGNLGTNIGLILNSQRLQSINQSIARMEANGVSGSDPEYLALINRKHALERDIRQGVQRHNGDPEFTEQEYQQRYGPDTVIDLDTGVNTHPRQTRPAAPARPAGGGAVHWRPWSEVMGGGGAHRGPGGDLARVRQTESRNNYNRVVYDTFRNMNLVSMTMGAIYDWQRRVLRPRTRGRRGPGDVGSTGVGAYQFESGTLAENAALEFGPGWRNVLFSQGNQDRVARRLHSRAGLTPWAIGGTGGRTSLRGGARTATRSGRGGGAPGVHVGSITVYVPPGTPRQQAERVADEIPRAVQRRGVVTQANKGLN